MATRWVIPYLSLRYGLGFGSYLNPSRFFYLPLTHLSPSLSQKFKTNGVLAIGTWKEETTKKEQF